MSVAIRMLETHPDPRGVDHAPLAEALDALGDVATAATQCADACLSGPAVEERVDCIRACADAADVAATTARVLGRTGPTVEGSRALLQAAARLLSECAQACAAHAEHHAHCRICADTCTRAERAIASLQTAVAAAVS